MFKLSILTCAVALLFFPAGPQNAKFSKYKAVETYEIRPGILMMPEYAKDGQVCQITLEKHHFSNEKADLNSGIPRETFIELINELVPMDERGYQTMNFGKEYISSYSGQSVNTFAEYENVSIDIFGTQSHRNGAGDIVAVISWKKRTCAAPKSTSVATTKPSH